MNDYPCHPSGEGVFAAMEGGERGECEGIMRGTPNLIEFMSQYLGNKNEQQRKVQEQMALDVFPTLSVEGKCLLLNCFEIRREVEDGSFLPGIVLRDCKVRELLSLCFQLQRNGSARLLSECCVAILEKCLEDTSMKVINELSVQEQLFVLNHVANNNTIAVTTTKSFLKRFWVERNGVQIIKDNNHDELIIEKLVVLLMHLGYDDLDVVKILDSCLVNNRHNDALRFLSSLAKECEKQRSRYLLKALVEYLIAAKQRLNLDLSFTQNQQQQMFSNQFLRLLQLRVEFTQQRQLSAEAFYVEAFHKQNRKLMEKLLDWTFSPPPPQQPQSNDEGKDDFFQKILVELLTTSELVEFVSDALKLFEGKKKHAPSLKFRHSLLLLLTTRKAFLRSTEAVEMVVNLVLDDVIVSAREEFVNVVVFLFHCLDATTQGSVDVIRLLCPPKFRARVLKSKEVGDRIRELYKQNVKRYGDVITSCEASLETIVSVFAYCLTQPTLLGVNTLSAAVGLVYIAPCIDLTDGAFEINTPTDDLNCSTIASSWLLGCLKLTMELFNGGDVETMKVNCLVVLFDCLRRYFVSSTSTPPSTAAKRLCELLPKEPFRALLGELFTKNETKMDDAALLDGVCVFQQLLLGSVNVLIFHALPMHAAEKKPLFDAMNHLHLLQIDLLLLLQAPTSSGLNAARLKDSLSCFLLRCLCARSAVISDSPPRKQTDFFTIEAHLLRHVKVWSAVGGCKACCDGDNRPFLFEASWKVHTAFAQSQPALESFCANLENFPTCLNDQLRKPGSQAKLLVFVKYFLAKMETCFNHGEFAKVDLMFRMFGAISYASPSVGRNLLLESFRFDLALRVLQCEVENTKLNCLVFMKELFTNAVVDWVNRKKPSDNVLSSASFSFNKDVIFKVNEVALRLLEPMLSCCVLKDWPGGTISAKQMEAMKLSIDVCCAFLTVVKWNPTAQGLKSSLVTGFAFEFFRKHSSDAAFQSWTALKLSLVTLFVSLIETTPLLYLLANSNDGAVINGSLKFAAFLNVNLEQYDSVELQACALVANKIVSLFTD